MRMGLAGAVVAGALAFCGGTALAVDPGDAAPDFEGKEFINSDTVSMKKLRGRVIFYEIFRTW